MKVVPSIGVDRAAILRNLDDLRKAIETGEIVAFIAVGIAQNDDTKAWTGNAGHKTQLQFIGASAHLHHSILHGLE